ADPEEAGRAGLDYFEKMFSQFGDLPTAIAAYHDGPTAIGKGKPWSKAAQNHVNKVLALMPVDDVVSDMLSAAQGAPAPAAEEDDLISDMLSAAQGAPAPSKKPIPKSDKGFFESIGPGFLEHKGLTENIADIASGAPPRGEEPEVDRSFSESAGRFVGMVGKEIVDPVGLALMLVPPARVAVGATARAAMIARASQAAKLGGGYELAAGAAEQVAEKGVDAPIDAGELATRTVIGAVGAPILEEGARAAGKVISNAWKRRYNDKVETGIDELGEPPAPPTTPGEIADAQRIQAEEDSVIDELNKISEEEAALDEAGEAPPPPQADPDAPPGTEGIEVEELPPVKAEEVTPRPVEPRPAGEEAPGTEGIEVEEIKPIEPEAPAPRPYDPKATIKNFDHDHVAFLEDAIDRPETKLNDVLDRIGTLKNPLWSGLAKGLRDLDLDIKIKMEPAENLRVG
ncbi:MAG: hypothetical protein L0191_18070, partial [Acidobacteria bacterium]|nr:hypothetical protein [Acidobacteriota bacterium]